MKLSVLASGSSGNSTFIESKESCILVDAGISSKAVINRLSAIGKGISDINAIFISHEHSDHIKGVERLNKKFDIPVFMNRATYEFSPLTLEKPNFFTNEKCLQFNDLAITPFSTNHDAADPCGFRVQDKEAILGIMTDFGKANAAVKQITNDADALVLETNHDIDMLINGPYPEHLKHRILSDKGHLSNADSGILVKNNASEKLKMVFLAHLSKNNNTEDLAMKTFTRLTEKNKHLKRILTKQNENTELMRI
jgi:phosphoribosyl 1,2-cyclic phosphodiesterase